MNNAKAFTPIKRFFRLLKLDRKDVTYIYIYAVFAGLITLSLPLGVQAIIGLIAGGSISVSLIILVLIVVVATALAGILKIMQLTVTETIQRRIFARAAFDLAFRLPRIKMESLKEEYPPELVNRFFDTLTIQKGIPKILIDFSTAILQITFGLILMSFYHPFFILFGIILVSLVLGIIFFTGPRGLKTSLEESKYKYQVAYWLQEIARTANTFKLAGDCSLPTQKTDNYVSNYLDARKKHFKVLVIQFGNIVAFRALVTGGLLILGAYLVIENLINIGQFVAAEIIIIQITASVEKLILTMETIYDVLTGLEKLGSVTDLPMDKEEGLSFDTIVGDGGISLEVNGLSYKYWDKQKKALKDISFEIKEGEKVCIAGYNGSGKSTLLKILTGIFQEYSGTISYNNFPMKNLNLISLRKHIGDHVSDEDIFKGTLHENISLANESVTLENIISVTEKVGLKKYIQQLPYGYQANLLPGGKNLPASIRKKILLARSIVTQPKLLAIEERFSDLQWEERMIIYDLLAGEEPKWTLLAVSDDPLFASKCDKIIILHEGKIVEMGTFEEVRKSLYFKTAFSTRILVGEKDFYVKEIGSEKTKNGKKQDVIGNIRQSIKKT